MCRLMGFVSAQEKTLVEATGTGFAQFAALSAHHRDGWGIATCNAQAHPTLLVEPTSARESNAFDQAAQTLKTNGALLHLRLATGGLEINEGNTHPFAYRDYSFTHNGALTPQEPVLPFIEPKYLALRRGHTDSESYFYLIVTEIEKYGVEQGIRSALKIIATNTKYSSINAMFLTPSELFVICEHDAKRRPEGEAEDYYDLFYKRENDEVVVASSGWNQDGWTQIPNRHLLKVDRSSFAITLTPLTL